MIALPNIAKVTKIFFSLLFAIILRAVTIAFAIVERAITIWLSNIELYIIRFSYNARFHYPVQCKILIKKSFVSPFIKKWKRQKKMCTKGVYLGE